MKSHYPDAGSISHYLKQISLAARQIGSTTQIWVMTCHQYGISVLVPPGADSGFFLEGVHH